MSNDFVFDILIIGAGPGGISLGVEAEAAGVPSDKIILLEKGPQHSWTIRKMYPEAKPVTANYKGIAAVCEGIMCLDDTTKEDTISYLDKAIDESGLNVVYDEEVFKIDDDSSASGSLFTVYGSKGTYKSKLVIISIGIFGRPNKPSIKIPRQVAARVHYDINELSGGGQKILVVGGGDSAGEFFQFLVQQKNEVGLSYRRANFSRMNQVNEQSVLALNEREEGQILWSSNIVEIKATEDGRPIVVFAETNLGEQIYDHVVFALGGTTPQNFLATAGIEFSGAEPEVSEFGESNVPGLFITGDLAAGKRGGSIAAAFNASRATMGRICENYLECELQPLVSPPVQEINNPATLFTPDKFGNGADLGDLVLMVSGRGRSRLRHLIDSRGAMLYFYHGEWCSDCSSYFNELKNQKDAIDPEMQIIAISSEKKSAAHTLIKNYKLWFPVAYGASPQQISQYVPIFYNEQRSVFEPAFFLLDKHCRVLHSSIGSSAGAKPAVSDLLKTFSILRK